MATRSSVALTVVKMPRTSQRSGWERRRWRAQAESLPEDQETRTGRGRGASVTAGPFGFGNVYEYAACTSRIRERD